MNIIKFKNLLAIFIIAFNILLSILISYSYFTNGFLENEFDILIKILVPIKSLDLSLALKYIIKNKNTLPTSINLKLNNYYVTITSSAIIIHALALGGLILLKSYNIFSNNLSFDIFLNIIVTIEVVYGVYVGYIINDLYKKETLHIFSKQFNHSIHN